VSDKNSGSNYGEYLPNPQTGKYVIILPPGNYTISISSDGLKTLSENIDLADKSSFVNEINKNFVLMPK